MTVAQRLYLLIASSVLGLLMLAATGIHEMNKVYAAADLVNLDTVPSLIDLDTAADGIALLRIAVWQRFAQDDPQKGREIEQRFATIRKGIDDALEKYERDDVSDDTDRAFVQADRQALVEVDALRMRVLAALNEGRTNIAKQILFEGQGAVEKLIANMQKHRAYNVQLGRENADFAKSTRQRSSLIAIGISVVVICIVTIMGVLLARRIVRSLNRAVAVAQTVASGNLASDIEVVSNDEIGQLMGALRHMNASLRHIVSQVLSGTHTIATASAQIAMGNQDFSVRTEHQASALQQTALSMERLTITVKQNAENASTASGMARSASASATGGGEQVMQVVQTMGAINASARRIVDIISVIDGIAFQTNILALNAAVEAARAGEQGRGFAVVATEVRNLARRSAEAAREVKSLIEESVSQVDSGGVLVDSAGKSMVRIVDGIKDVTEVVGNISTASKEQTAGIEKISYAIAAMDQATRKNAALVEEAAAAALALQEQAQALNGLVSVFIIDPELSEPQRRRPVQMLTASA